MAVDVLILVALLAEERLLQEAVQGPSERVIAGKRFVDRTLGGKGVAIGATGMGKVNYDIPFLAIRGISDVEGGAMEQLKRFESLAMSNAVRIVQSVLAALDFSEPVD